MPMRTRSMSIIMEERVPRQLHKHCARIRQRTPPFVQASTRDASTQRGIDRCPPSGYMQGAIGHRFTTTLQRTNALDQCSTYGAALLGPIGGK
jgi:hypothetical protein